MLLGSDAEAARSSLYRQVKKANKEASKKRRDEKKSNKSRLGQLDREISMIEKLLEKNVPTIDYTPEPQGEAICWYQGDFYTISEKNKGKPQEMLLFQRLK